MDLMTNAARDVLSERKRQVEREGWSATHDDEHKDGGLARAAVCYAAYPDMESIGIDWGELWPWDWKWWKPKNRRRDLVRAGALILAEIERMDRAALQEAEGE